MMKKYMKPSMESEMFVANEYISACGGMNAFSCLNMNNTKNGAPTVYYDPNMNGIHDSDETAKVTGWDEKNDCVTSGSTVISGIHEITDTEKNDKSLRVIVYYSQDNQVPAIIDKSTQSTHFSNSPHFVSLKAANHS